MHWVIDMRKVYYISATEADKNGTGIAYKIFKQMEIMRLNGLDVKEVSVYKKMSVVDKILSKFPFVNKRVNLTPLEKIEEFSVIYIRYFLIDFWIYFALKKLKQKNVKIIIEFPTYPYDREYKKFHPYILKDRIWRKYLNKLVNKCVTFSDDKKIYGIECINISNGVDVKKIRKRHPKENMKDINMIAVAKFAPWHGYDRIIQGIANYYKKNDNTVLRKVKLYIVGYGDQKIEEVYRKKIYDNDLEDIVILTGKKSGKELDYLYDHCNLAIDSLGRHRSQVKYNSSLKGKEYMAKGLPIVSGVCTELDTLEEYPYYYRVPADDSPLDIMKIIDFCDGIYNNEDKETVALSIRECCEKYFDINKCFDPVIDELKS